MDNVLSKIPNADSYIDDICVYSPTFKDQLNDLRRTLEAFRGANVQLRRDKCKVGMYEGEFVGHVIAASGHRPLPSLIEKIFT